MLQINRHAANNADIRLFVDSFCYKGEVKVSNCMRGKEIDSGTCLFLRHLKLAPFEGCFFVLPG